jgi:hypothetical protein
MATATKQQSQEVTQPNERQEQFAPQSSQPPRTTGGSRAEQRIEPNSKQDYVELKYRSVKDVSAENLAMGLGWFSIALGLAQIAMPNRLGEIIGVGNRPMLFSALGAREIASGIGILSQPRPAAAVWSRVAGDAMDLALLGAALMSKNNDRRKVLIATLAVAGVTAADVICAQMLSQKLDETARHAGAPTTIGQSSGRHAENEK